MFIGTAFFYLYKRLLNQWQFFAVALIFLLVFLLIWKSGFPDSFKFSWNYIFALLTFGTCFYLRDKIKGNNITTFFADISYPLYTMHGVFGYSCMRILIEEGVPAGMSIFITFLIVVSIAYVIHKLIEEPSQKFGKSLAKKLINPLKKSSLK